MIECVERSHFFVRVFELCSLSFFCVWGYACFFVLYVIAIFVVMHGVFVKSMPVRESVEQRGKNS